MEELLGVKHWEEKLKERDYNPQCQKCKIEIYGTLVKYAKRIEHLEEDAECADRAIELQKKLIDKLRGQIK
jgi:hypothetical protein